MFGLSTWELLIILLVVMLVFGARRLPELGKGLGEGLRSFKDAMRADKEATKASVPDATTSEESPKNT